MQGWIEPWKTPDFRWVWFTRFANAVGFYLIYHYLRYFLTDVVPSYEIFGFEIASRGSGSEEDVGSAVFRAVFLLAMVSSLFGALGAVAGGWWADRIGRKRTVVVSGALMALPVVPFIFVRDFTVIALLAIPFAIGYGAYQASDWALAADVMPDKKALAKDMGIWQSCVTAPQIVSGGFGAIVTAGNRSSATASLSVWRRWRSWLRWASFRESKVRHRSLGDASVRTRSVRMNPMISLIACSSLLLTSCSEPPAASEGSTPQATTISTDLDRLPMTDKAGWKVETVVSNVQVPWTIAWDHEGRMIFTERPGRVRVFENGKLREQPLLTLPDVAARSESGLMGMCLHPNYKDNRYIYLAYSYRDGGEQYVKVVRYKNDGAQLAVDKTIIDKIPAAPNHAGTRVAFGPDGKLYVTTGDATDWHRAQQMDSINGKTLRLNDDGSIPRDNPFVGKPNVREEIWSYGHRNAQGLAWQPGTNKMFQTEHGPSGFEGLGGGACELNMVEAGKNYGYGPRTREGMVSPLVEYSPAAAPGSGMFYSGDKLPMFKNNYFFGALRPGILVRVVLDGSKVVNQERVITDLGRIREVAQGPDGFLYFSTSNRDGRGRPAGEDDRIMRIVPN